MNWNRCSLAEGSDSPTRDDIEQAGFRILRLCSVGFKSATGISHSVDVEAETLCEAAGLGLASLKKDGWIEGLGPGTRLEIVLPVQRSRAGST